MKITYSDMCKCGHIHGVHKIAASTAKGKFISYEGCEFETAGHFDKLCPCLEFKIDNLIWLEKLSK